MAPKDPATWTGPESQAAAQRVWVEIFNRDAYTSLTMINFMLCKAHRDNWPNAYKKMLENPKTCLGNAKVEDVTKEFFSYDLVEFADRYAGRCTTFAIHVAHELVRRYPTGYKFSYYDLGGHRVALDLKHGIVIDSSSKAGAVELRADQEWTVNAINQKWKYSKATGETKFISSSNTNTQQKPQLSADPINEQKCMQACMLEVFKSNPILCFFRSANEHGNPTFYGMIKWNGNRKQFELSSYDPPAEEGGKPVKKVTRLQFGVDGVDEAKRPSTQDMLDIMEAFASANTGGPHGQQQWNAEGVKSTAQHVVVAAMALYKKAWIQR